MNNFATTPNIQSAAELNKAIVRRQVELWATGDLDRIAAFFHPDTCNHGEPVGRDGIRFVLGDIWETFPDWRAEIAGLAADGDEVVVRMWVSATHRGVGRLPVNGGLLVGVAPTGRSFTAQHIHWYRLRDGMIVDHHATRDDLGMMQQLGLLPAAPAL